MDYHEINYFMTDYCLVFFWGGECNSSIYHEYAITGDLK
ncbi:Hypothetical protein W5S_0026 [Pectobacterium parmentieri]|uniref:Uncharacterized protein n=1 Tax=Pectobacterium parmentieri TaxID=1905730 RepID=A0A0H3I304_PECPM|nr:Hypothetical protein W5S_0026 [Pectobacterium parmentieri]POW26686.1 hypothetical protein PB20LOC_02644 [Pectobacterium parmentieri]